MANKGVDLGRLCAAIQRARLALRRYREERREAVRQYVGNHWSEEGARQIVPVNLLALYAKVIKRHLIAKNPRVLLSTFLQAQKAMVGAMESWANQKIEEIDLARTLQRAALDGLFSVGIVKVALATPAESAVAGWTLPAGSPFAERVDLDDFVFDVHARDLSEAGFIGHRYRVPLEVIRDSTLYSKQRKELAPSPDQPFNLEGDERVSMLGRSYYTTNEEEFEDFVDLWEIYVPRKKLVLTLADDMLTGASGGGDGTAGLKPLREQEWVGPDWGPYHFLAYETVPGNAMPKGPMQDLIDLHELANRLYRKLGRQSERQKEMLLVRGGAAEDGSRIVEGNDGDAIRSDNPENTKVAAFGGPDERNFRFALHVKDLFSWIAGNLETIGGLSPQAKTLGQEQLLSANSSGLVADMQETTVNFTASVLRSLCWFWYHHPREVMRVRHNLPGLPDISQTRQVDPRQRQQMRFEDLGVKVDPYSMQHSTPAMKVQAVTQTLQQLQPFMQLAQQQGVGLDLHALVALLSRYLDLPELTEIMTVAQPPQQESPSPEQGPGMPSQTTRKYERYSTGGQQGAQAKDASLQSLLEGTSRPNGQQQNGVAGGVR